MINRNTASKAWYIFENIYWLLLFMWVYNVQLFYPLPGHSYEESKLALWIVAVTLDVIGVIATFNCRRNDVSTLSNTVLPFELYTLITFYHFFPVAVLSLSLIPAILAAVYFVRVLTQRESSHTGRKVCLSKRIWHGILGCRTIITVCLLFFIIPLYICSIFSIYLYTSDVEPAASPAEDTEWSVKNKIDTVKLLEEDSWAELNTQERLDVLGTIVNIEVRYLGINHPIQLKSGVLKGDVAAHYENDSNCIVVDLPFLVDSGASEALHAICHECYHAYQYQQVALLSIVPAEYRNMLMFDNVEEYEKEFLDYEDGTHDLVEYALQKCEIDANQYASSAVDEYYKLIGKYSQAKST